MPEILSGLEDAVRPIRFGEGAPSIDRRHAMFEDDADLEDPEAVDDADDFEELDDFDDSDDREDETLLLAPRRDFSPSAMARDEGAAADIESPFAQSESKTVTELMSPVRQAYGDPEQSQHVFEAKAPVTDKSPAAHTPPMEPEPPLPPVSPMSPASAPISPSSIRPRLVRSELEPPKPDPAPARPLAFGGDDIVPRRRPVNAPQSEAATALEGPLSFGDDDVVPRRRPVSAPQSEAAPALEGPLSFGDDDVVPRRRPVNVPQPESPPAPEGPLSFGDDDAVPRRRPVNTPQPESPPAPEGPPAPGLLRRAIGAMSRVGTSCLGGGAIALRASKKACFAFGRGLGAAWALYSRGCLALQGRLSLLAGSALGQACARASHAGSASQRLARMGVEGCRIGGAYALRAVNAAARHGLVLAKAAPSFANKSVVRAGVLILRIRALAVSAFGKLRLVAGSWLVTWATRRAAAAEAAKAVQTLNARASIASTRPKASSPPSPAENAPAPQVAAKPAMALKATPPSVKTPTPAKTPSTAEKVSENAPASVDTALAQSTSRLTWRHGPQRLALAGLAAASVVFLIAAFAFSPATDSANVALTFPIPEKPVIGVIPLKEAASFPSELDDPIALMLAHVGEQVPAAPAVSDESPVLARARSVEGLSQFVRAAEIAGLGELLQPGEAYTIFVPNDQAFAKLAAGEVDSLLEPAGHERLLTLLSHHVLPGRLSVGDVRGDVVEHTSLAGALVSIDATEVMSVGGASMVETDLAASNGVLHVIDQILPITTP